MSEQNTFALHLTEDEHLFLWWNIKALYERDNPNRRPETKAAVKSIREKLGPRPFSVKLRKIQRLVDAARHLREIMPGVRGPVAIEFDAAITDMMSELHKE